MGSSSSQWQSNHVASSPTSAKDSDSTAPWSVDTDGLKLKNGSFEDIEAYLADDEEDIVDQGTVVVIGRVHFFTGDARTYQGMPADAPSLYDSPSASVKRVAAKTSKEDSSKGAKDSTGSGGGSTGGAPQQDVSK